MLFPEYDAMKYNRLFCWDFRELKIFERHLLHEVNLKNRDLENCYNYIL